MKDLSKDSVTWLEVGEEAEGQRLDNFLLRIAKGVPKSHIYRIVRSGEVRVNKGRVQAEYRLKVGDRLRVPPMRTADRPSQVAVPARDFEVAFEDDALIVIDKPAGVAVHGGSGVSFGVIEQLRRARPLAKFLELAHRLDRDTSGLLVVAKTIPAQTDLVRQLQVVFGVDPVQPRAHYRDGGQGVWRRAFQGPLVRRAVNAQRQTRHYGQTRAAQGLCERFGIEFPLGCGVATAHHRNAGGAFEFG